MWFMHFDPSGIQIYIEVSLQGILFIIYSCVNYTDTQNEIVSLYPPPQC